MGYLIIPTALIFAGPSLVRLKPIHAAYQQIPLAINNWANSHAIALNPALTKTAQPELCPYHALTAKYIYTGLVLLVWLSFSHVIR